MIDPLPFDIVFDTVDSAVPWSAPIVYDDCGLPNLAPIIVWGAALLVIGGAALLILVRKLRPW